MATIAPSGTANDFKRSPNVAPPRCSVLFLRGLGWLGSFGLLSSGIVLAQGAARTAVASTPGDPALATPASMKPVVTPISPNVVPQALEAPVSPSPERAIVQPTLSQPTIDQPNVALPKRAVAHPESSYDAPTSIVLTERSTGCRAVLRSGQLLNGSPCALDSRWQAANAPVVSRSLPVVSVQSFSMATTSPTPTWKDYYNRTARPPGRLGNGNIRLIFPLSIPAPISSLFGWRTHPITGEQRFHSGTDLAAPLGTPVLAAYAGKVAIADFLGGYGLAIALDHNKGTQETVYGHLSEIFVKPGEWVKQGMVIGRVGSTGLSTGPHLHFEFRQFTPDGWVAMDAGMQLEYALAQLITAMQVAQAKAAPKS